MSGASRRRSRPLVSPHELGETVDGYSMATRCQQDLEHLLGPDTAEVSWPEAARDHPRSKATRTAGSPAVHGSRLPRPGDPHICKVPSGRRIVTERLEPMTRSDRSSQLASRREWAGRARLFSGPTQSWSSVCAMERSARSSRLSPISFPRCWRSPAATPGLAVSPKRSCRRPGSRFSRASTASRAARRCAPGCWGSSPTSRGIGPSARLARCRSRRWSSGTRSLSSTRGGSTAPTSRIPEAGGRSRPTGERCPSRVCSSGRPSTSSLGAIAELPEAQRAVITLRDVIGCGAQEVSETLGISQGNQRVLLHRARVRVRAQLERHLDG